MIFRYLFVAVLSSIQLTLFCQSDIDQFNAEADLFFSNYVKDKGVNYKKLHQDNSALSILVKKAGNMEVTNEINSPNLSFYINAYNILVINQISANYPLESVMSISGFFDRNKFKVAGSKMTLNELENEVIRKRWNDPRVHFALVCGAKGCPPILDAAYQANSLDSQLNVQTMSAINDPDFIRMKPTEKMVEISEIFNWYKEDFGKNDQNIINYLNGFSNEEIPTDHKIKYYRYDWSLNEFKEAVTPFDPKEDGEMNLQTYTPSVLMQAGQWEFKSFQNLYTQTGGYGNDNMYTDFGNRSNFFSSINQLTIGINDWINVGADLWIKSVLYNGKDDSPLELFEFQNTPQSRTELTGIGPKLRIRPFKKLDHFSINSTWLFPVSSDLNGSESNSEAWLSPDAHIWITQFYYDQPLGQSFQLFFQFAPWYTLTKQGENAENKLETPVDVFFSWFPSNRITLYAQQNFWPAFDAQGEFTSYFLQGGLGAKYQLIPGLLELETSYTNFYYGWNAGAGQTFNLGVRIIR